MTSVLITGGTGFVGAHLVRACLARGYRVSVLTRSGSSTERLAQVLPVIETLQVDYADLASMRVAVREAEADIIFHLAATTRYTSQDPLHDAVQSIDDNLTPLLVLLAAATETPPKVLIRSGTIAEYGDIARPYLEAAREAPRSVYAASMLAGTQYLGALRAGLPFAAITARLALTYGPMQNRDFLIPQLIGACRAGNPLSIHRPRDRRDLIHVSDVVCGLLKLADAADDAPDIVNLATGYAPTMAQLARKLMHLTGAQATPITILDQTEPATELVASPALAKRTLGWQARISLDEGLRRTLQWTPQNALHPSDPSLRDQQGALPLRQVGTAR